MKEKLSPTDHMVLDRLSKTIGAFKKAPHELNANKLRLYVTEAMKHFETFGLEQISIPYGIPYEKPAQYEKPLHTE